MILGPDDTPDIAQMGGKAFALAKLGADYPIPPWRVVTPDHVVGSEDWQQAGLGPGPFAVRSSAVEEDQAGHSFAGQLQSYLNVPADQVANRIQAVRDSVHGESVLAYRRMHRLQQQPAVPAVIVQQMVPAQCAGVAFSVDPVDGRLVTVIATSGLADKLVDGMVDGDMYRLTRDGKPVSATVQGGNAVLDTQMQRSVAALVLRAEACFGRPQDIEWAIAGGQLHLLQSRPITTLGEATLWDNSNIVESYSGVTSPLTFSFARHVYSQIYRTFCRLLGVPAATVTANGRVFDNMLGYVDGHVYYNLLNWYRVLALLPGFGINRRFMEQMMGVSSPLPDDTLDQIAPRRGGIAAWGRLGWSLACLVVHAIRLPRDIAAFQQRLDGALERCPPSGDLTTLARRYRELEALLLDRWDAPLTNDFLCMIAFGTSRLLLRRWCSSDDLHNELMIGQGGIISAEPARRIRQMAEAVRDDQPLVAALCAGDARAAEGHPVLQQAIADYLRDYGDRCAQELKLESLTLHDDPAPLLQAIGHCAGRVTAPLQVRSDSLEQALAGHPLRLAIARRVVGWARARVRDRENLRFERTRVFGRVRRIFLEIGRRLAETGVVAQPRDIFHLEVGEVLGLIEGTATCGDPQGLVALRRGVTPHEPPPARFWTYGAACTSRRQPVATHQPTSRDRRQGLGCCPGIIRAPVRVIDDPRSQSLHTGEILVARHTDPGWIALFSNAAGIAVERGSLLSHSAIVAREMNIPAVVAVAGLMDWLKTGDIVELDGHSGTIVKVSHETP